MGESKYLNVLVGARVDNLTKGLKKALKKVKAFGSKAADLAKRAGKAIAAGIAAGMTAALAGATVQLGRMGEQARMAADAGTSVEAFSRLAFAAKASGVEVDTVSEALKEWGLRLSEAVNLDSGPAAEALKQLGIEAESLVGLDPAETMARLAGEMEGLSTADRNYIADALWGGDANQMLSLIAQGEEGIRSLAAESDALGATMTDAEAGAAKAFNSSMNKLWATLDGVATSISATLAPVMTSFVELAGSGAAWIAKKFQEWQGTLVTVFSTVEWTVNNWSKVWDVAVASVALSLVTWWEETKFLFTSTIPAVLSNAASYILGVFDNLAANIGQIMGEVWDYVASMGDDPIELNLLSLTDGIELPDLPERERTKVEEALASDLAAKVGAASKGIDELVAERMAVVAPPSADTADRFDGGKGLDDPDGEGDGEKSGSRSGGNEAVRAGSVEAVSAFIQAAGGVDPEKEQVALLKQIARLQREANRKDKDKKKVLALT